VIPLPVAAGHQPAVLVLGYRHLWRLRHPRRPRHRRAGVALVVVYPHATKTTCSGGVRRLFLGMASDWPCVVRRCSTAPDRPPLISAAATSESGRPPCCSTSGLVAMRTLGVEPALYSILTS
jgi:hypothetical protein